MGEMRTELPFCCLRCRLSLEEEYYICKLCPTPTLFQVFPQKGYIVRLPLGVGRQLRVWGLQSWGCNVKGRRPNLKSYLCSVHKMGACGFEKLLFPNGGIDDVILEGGGTVALRIAFE